MDMLFFPIEQYEIHCAFAYVKNVFQNDNKQEISFVITFSCAQLNYKLYMYTLHGFTHIITQLDNPFTVIVTSKIKDTILNNLSY